MLEYRVANWDNAYSNGPNIPRGDAWPQAWVEPAGKYRADLSSLGRAKLDILCGKKPRNRLDLFLPAAAPKGLVVFVHGGFWLRLDKSFWSHLSAGAVDSGYAVAIPSYTLCPEVRIADIVLEVGAAIHRAAELVEGPIMLTGHSAGGHLVSRMVSATTPLSPALQAQIRNVISISGLHDLRPLMNTEMNGTLRLDEKEATTESPALLRPMDKARITCWVGGNERQEFLRQSALLANIWAGLNATTAFLVEPDRHHFNVIEGLADSNHPLMRALLG